MLFLLRLVSFVAVMVSLFNGYTFIAMVAIALVFLYRNAYEYIFLGLFVDLYFSPDPVRFWYVLAIAGLFLVIYALRPYLHLKDTFLP
jgi:hypothetical protein